MTNLTLTIPLPAHQHPASSKCLLGLPLELRNHIYHHTLVAPPKHSRTHDDDCHFRYNHNATSIEPAACVVLDVAVDPVPLQYTYRHDRLSQCRCAKRATLNFLLACRQVHREAAPVFWSANTFVFDHSDDFTICVGARLRPAFCPLLRHVYVASADCEENPLWTTRNLFSGAIISTSDKIPRWLQFWGVLNQCRGLRTLAVQPEVVQRHSADLAALSRRLPALERLELTWMGKYTDDEAPHVPSGRSLRACGPVQREMVFVRAARSVDLGAADFGGVAWCKELYRDFTTNFCVHLDTIVRNRFLGCGADGPDRYRIELHTGRVEAGLNDARRTWNVKLPTGKTARLDFLAVPQSRETRMRLKRQRRAQDAARRASGKPTVAEERVQREIQARRAENKSREAEEEARERELVLAERRRREEEREANERREREDRRAELQRAVEAAREERRVERKRVVRRGVEEEVGELALRGGSFLE
ncbi:ribosomal protein L32 [Colletotrichum graminicola M1.001]|uniref:Ribosomal protein L32 n=1 Tax=Colletotrichum graminicola (strain M1.001 / M2 / FGSC 10212) TaxID=645133 RepID=E3QWU7_COLGM|nr:ribosomal protein L32 [Colletotrichum graminicola M1.001]EFQ35335.1 ribosomal protein L32 [Colletotrichum graminicola M1.001]